MFGKVTLAALFAAFLMEVPSPAAPTSYYRWLTTDELEALLRGNWIVEADTRPSYMRTPEHFERNGHYVRHADNFEAHGTYSFRNGKVCDQAETDPEVCRGVLIDKAGRYWIVGRDNSQLLTKISVKPLQ